MIPFDKVRNMSNASKQQIELILFLGIVFLLVLHFVMSDSQDDYDYYDDY